MFVALKHAYLGTDNSSRLAPPVQLNAFASSLLPLSPPSLSLLPPPLFAPGMLYASFSAAQVYNLAICCLLCCCLHSVLPVFDWLGLPAATAWGWVLQPSPGYIGQVGTACPAGRSSWPGRVICVCILGSAPHMACAGSTVFLLIGSCGTAYILLWRQEWLCA